MTTGILLGLLARRWYVVVVGLVLALGAMHMVRSVGGVYSAQVDVLFLTPKSVRYPNSIQQTSSSVVSLAGLIERVLNGSEERPASASSGVTLVGRGIDSGHSIVLPDAGGQWAHDFSRPVLIVQVVGPDPQWVETETDRQVARINDELESIQMKDGVPSSDLITTSSAPATVDVRYLSGRPMWAVGVTGLLSLWLTVLSAVAVETLVNRRRARRPAVTMAHAT